MESGTGGPQKPQIFVYSTYDFKFDDLLEPANAANVFEAGGYFKFGIIRMLSIVGIGVVVWIEAPLLIPIVVKFLSNGLQRVPGGAGG